MKAHKLFIALIVVIALAVPNAFAEHQPYQNYGGDGGTGSGSCLDAYNGCLMRCDYLGGNTQLACKADCLVSYYACIYYTATQ